MADEITKQRFNAKAEILATDIEDNDIGIMTHKPNSVDGGDRKFKFSTLVNWLKGKLDLFPVPEGKDKLLLSTETTWTQVNKDEVGEVTLKMTKAEWEDYDKTKIKANQSVILTDDNEVVSPVNVVEEGNLNAVTSNAVAGEIEEINEKFAELQKGRWYEKVVTTNSSGYAIFNWSDFGLSERPNKSLIVQMSSGTLTLSTYLYDESSSNVKIKVYRSDTGAIIVNTVVRLTIIVPV